MVRLIKILKNYENICKLGREIIKHKENIPKTYIEKRNKEILLKEFSDAIKKADKEWKRIDKLS